MYARIDAITILNEGEKIMHIFNRGRRTIAIIVCSLFLLTLSIPFAAAEGPVPAPISNPAPGSTAGPLAVIPAGASTEPVYAVAQETVLFEDTFARPDSASPGPQWQEFINRRAENNLPRQADSPWSVKNNSLYFTCTGQHTYVEDLVSTTAAFPIDNTRIEFEIRATAATQYGYVGPSCFWIENPLYRGGAVNVSKGSPVIGVQGWYRWENGGTRGLVLMGNANCRDYANAVFEGVNQPAFEKHVITVKDGKIIYQNGMQSPVELTLGQPVAPGEMRHLSFSARLYDKGITETIEIRNVRITALASTSKLGASLEDQLEEALSETVDQMSAQAVAEFDPLLNQMATLSTARSKTINDEVTKLVEAAIKPAVEEQIRIQLQTAQSQAQMASAMGSTGMPDLSSAPPEIQAQIRQQIEEAKQAAIADAKQQIETASAEIMTTQMQALQPQIDQIVQKYTMAMLPEMKALIKPHIQASVPKMNKLADAAITANIAKLSPLLPPDIKKLPVNQQIAILRPEIESEIRPQIDALIDEEIQAVIQKRVIGKVQEEVLRDVGASFDRLNAEIDAFAKAETVKMLPDSPDVASVNKEINALIQSQLQSNRAYLLSEVQSQIVSTSTGINKEMDAFARAELAAALAPPKAPGAKKVLKKPIVIKKKKK